MALDVALGALVLIAGLRGWFKGFMVQAIGLAALVAGIYAADPLRDLARPFALEHLPAIRAEVLDKLLWWCSAVASFVVIGGVGKGLLKASRRRTFEDPTANRGDQGAGFLLGGIKGGLVAVFLAAALSKHAPTYLEHAGYVKEQVESSRALAWTATYKPADTIWNSPPVQALVTRVRTRGLGTEPAETTKPTRPEPPPVRTAERPKSLELPKPPPPPRRLDPADGDFIRRLDDELRREGLGKSS